MQTGKTFLSTFRFSKQGSKMIGVEREWFLRDRQDNLTSKAQEFLTVMNDANWSYELSSYQVEGHTAPVKTYYRLEEELKRLFHRGHAVAKKLCLRLSSTEVAEERIPLTVYPDPRYLQLAKIMPENVLRAACRVIGTHIHLGCEDINHALEVYNALLPHLDKFCAMGDHSNGVRLQLYKQVAPNWLPPSYSCVEEFVQTAREQGFIDNPRNCYHLVRISQHGTVELRMFGVTKNIDEMIEWARSARNIAGF